MDKKTIKEINKRLSKENIDESELLKLKVEIVYSLIDCPSDSLFKLQKRINHVLYECRYCANAKFKYKYSDGDERELFVDDCGKDNCPYADYFENQKKDNKIDLILKKMLEE